MAQAKSSPLGLAAAAASWSALCAGARAVELTDGCGSKTHPSRRRSFNAELERGCPIEAGPRPDEEPFIEPRDTRKMDKGPMSR
jgi:hypothetical protein